MPVIQKSEQFESGTWPSLETAKMKDILFVRPQPFQYSGWSWPRMSIQIQHFQHHFYKESRIHFLSQESFPHLIKFQKIETSLFMIEISHIVHEGKLGNNKPEAKTFCLVRVIFEILEFLGCQIKVISQHPGILIRPGIPIHIPNMPPLIQQYVNGPYIAHPLPHPLKAPKRHKASIHQIPNLMLIKAPGHSPPHLQLPIQAKGIKLIIHLLQFRFLQRLLFSLNSTRRSCGSPTSVGRGISSV